MTTAQLMSRLVLIAAGGAAGTLLRYWLQGLLQTGAGGTFPLGTLVVNIAGCLVIGFLGAAFAGPVLVREDIRLALIVGVLGGFTTFSSFAYESLRLLNDGQYAWAALYVGGSNIVGLFAAWGGSRVALAIYGGSS